MTAILSKLLLLMLLVCDISLEIHSEQEDAQGLDTGNHWGSYLCQQTCDCGSQRTTDRQGRFFHSRNYRNWSWWWSSQNCSLLSSFCLNISEKGLGGGIALPRDCAELQYQGHTRSGVYTVYVGDLGKPVSVYCDLQHNDGGWLVRLEPQEYKSWVASLWKQSNTIQNKHDHAVVYIIINSAHFLLTHTRSTAEVLFLQSIIHFKSSHVFGIKLL